MGFPEFCQLLWHINKWKEGALGASDPQPASSTGNSLHGTGPRVEAACGLSFSPVEWDSLSGRCCQHAGEYWVSQLVSKIWT